MEDMLRELEQKIETEGATKASLRQFWKLADRAKMKKQISQDDLDRIVRLRDTLFGKFYPPFLTLRQGLALTAVATLVGAVLIWYGLQSDQLLLFLTGSAFLMVGTHPWGHWMAGKSVGVNFEYFYLDGPAKFEPCLKIDYKNYLKASFNSRMIVHASGALVTVLTAVTLLLVALTTGGLWMRSIALAIFIVVVITEIVSWAGIASGDLKRVRREVILKKHKKSFN